MHWGQSATNTSECRQTMEERAGQFFWQCNMQKSRAPSGARKIRKLRIFYGICNTNKCLANVLQIYIAVVFDDSDRPTGTWCWHFSKCSVCSCKITVVRRLKKLQLSKLLSCRRGRVWHVLRMPRHQPHVVIVSWRIWNILNSISIKWWWPNTAQMLCARWALSGPASAASAQ